MYDLIIIGAGVSGLSASIYAGSRGIKTLVLEKNKIGGLVNEISTISHYLGVENEEKGEDFSRRIYKQALMYDTDFKNEEVINIDFENKIITTNISKYRSKAIILAMGTEKKELFINNIEKYLEKNIFYIANKHVQKVKNKTVVVLGSGDGAFKEAIFLSKYAKKVYILTKDEDPNVVFEFRNKVSKISNIQLLRCSNIISINGNEKLKNIVIENEKTKEIIEIKDDEELFLFIFIGRIPNIKMLDKIKLENGAIKVNSELSTNISGIFASGDIVNKKIRQISTAVSDGTIAAINAYNFLKRL